MPDDFSSVERVGADVDGPNGVAFHIKNRPQIGFNDDRIDCLLKPARKLVDAVRTQARIERIELEDFPFFTNTILLLGR